MFFSCKLKIVWKLVFIFWIVCTNLCFFLIYVHRFVINLLSVCTVFAYFLICVYRFVWIFLIPNTDLYWFSKLCVQIGIYFINSVHRFVFIFLNLYTGLCLFSELCAQICVYFLNCVHKPCAIVLSIFLKSSECSLCFKFKNHHKHLVLLSIYFVLWCIIFGLTHLRNVETTHMPKSLLSQPIYIAKS